MDLTKDLYTCSDILYIGNMRERSDQKAKRYVKEGKVFPLRNTPNYEMWCIEGETGIWGVRFDKVKEIYSCTCKNIRLTPCSHIKAVKLYKGEDDAEDV